MGRSDARSGCAVSNRASITVLVRAGPIHPRRSSLAVPKRVAAAKLVTLSIFAADYDGNPATMLSSAAAHRRNRFVYEVRWLPQKIHRTSSMRGGLMRMSIGNVSAAFSPWNYDGSDDEEDPREHEVWSTSAIVSEGYTHLMSNNTAAHVAYFVAPSRKGRFRVSAWVSPCTRRHRNLSIVGSHTTRYVVAARVAAERSTASPATSRTISSNHLPLVHNTSQAAGSTTVPVGSRVVVRLQLRDAFGNTCHYGGLPSIDGECAQRDRSLGRGLLKISASLVRSTSNNVSVARAHTKNLPSGEVELTAIPLQLGRLRWDINVGEGENTNKIQVEQLPKLLVIPGSPIASTSDFRVCRSGPGLPPRNATIAWIFTNALPMEKRACMEWTSSSTTTTTRAPIAIARIRSPAVLTLRLLLRDPYRNEVTLVTMASPADTGLTNDAEADRLSTALEERITVVVDMVTLPRCSLASIGRTLHMDSPPGCAALYFSGGFTFVALRLPLSSLQTGNGDLNDNPSFPPHNNSGGNEEVVVVKWGNNDSNITPGTAPWWCVEQMQRVQVLIGGVALKMQPRSDDSMSCSEKYRTQIADDDENDDDDDDDENDDDDDDDDSNGNNNSDKENQQRRHHIAYDELGIVVVRK